MLLLGAPGAAWQIAGFPSGAGALTAALLGGGHPWLRDWGYVARTFIYSLFDGSVFV